jgi:hypothetical protein
MDCKNSNNYNVLCYIDGGDGVLLSTEGELLERSMATPARTYRASGGKARSLSATYGQRAGAASNSGLEGPTPEKGIISCPGSQPKRKFRIFRTSSGASVSTCLIRSINLSRFNRGPFFMDCIFDLLNEPTSTAFPKIESYQAAFSSL